MPEIKRAAADNAARDGVSTRELVDYWDERSTSYFKGVAGELSDERRGAWVRLFDALVEERPDGNIPRVLDLGCGPGFFSVIFAARGFEVSAIDMSAAMIERARQNLEAESLADRVECYQGDFTSLPFADNMFDLAVARNVTWLMRDPEAAYAEWLRVLAPGGKLLVFDANWYYYLASPEADAKRKACPKGDALEGWDEEAQATSDEEERCEEMTRKLPLSSVLRPAWDLETLARLGASSVRADEGVWRDLWTESEQVCYAYAPLFLVEAVK